MATRGKSDNKNIKALFSVICLCIIALGLIVYFSTMSTKTTKVNEPTTVKQVETTTEVQKRVTVKETTQPTQVTEAQSTTSTPTTKKQKKSEPATMKMGDTNTPYKSFYKYPCDEAVINGYSEELVKNETMGDYRSHTAVDFKVAKGGKVSAVNDGLVIGVKNDAMLGKVVEIDHGGKFVARYCGLDTINVSIGDYVTIGQALGTAGKVPFEASLDSHLHFEATIDGKTVNPLDVMSKTE